MNHRSRAVVCLAAKKILDEDYEEMADEVEFALIELEEIWGQLDSAQDDLATRKQMIDDWLDEKLATSR